MKKTVFILLFLVCFLALGIEASAQCSICAKTVAQLGNKTAHGFNDGIIYLMIVPYIAIGIVGYKWWKSNGIKP